MPHHSRPSPTRRWQPEKLMRGIVVGTALMLASQASHAAVLSFFGFGYSEKKVYKKVKAYVDTAGNVLSLAPATAPIGLGVKLVVVAADVLDPPGANAIIKGRATIRYDSSYQVLGAGWFGEFGADPQLAAPPVALPPSEDGVDLLQTQHNAAMVSGSITPTPGQTVFEFDWGPNEFVPTANLDAEGHFNIAALYVYSPTFADILPNTSAENVFHMVGTPADIQAQGTAAPTYMLCSSGYCGVNPVPEPATALSLLTGLGCVALTRRQRSAQKNTGAA